MNTLFQTEKPSRPALRYHGGKWMLASWIISHFPAHRVFVEPYGGAASVLLRKPRSYAEIYNDANGEIVNLFRVLQDPAAAHRLKELLYLTPFSRDEFRSAYEPAVNDPIEEARRLIIRAYMGFGSAAHNKRHSTGFRCSSDRSGTTPAHDWMHFPDAIPAMVERLRGVTIENRPALDLIQKRDGEDYLFYCDPPYVHSSRGHRQHGNYGHFEMADEEHRAMAAALNSVKGKVVLSGYQCPLYAELFKDWRRVTKRTHGNGNVGATSRTEVLWMNF